MENENYNPTGYELTGKAALGTIASAWGGTTTGCAPAVIARTGKCREQFANFTSVPG